MTVAVVEKRYQVIKPKHGFYKGECLDTDIAPTIDTGVGCWHTLIGESMEEIKCEQVGMLSGDSRDKCHETNRRVYSSNGLSPTITTMGGGQREPKIIKPIVYDMYNKKQITNGICGTLTAHGNTSSTHCGTFGIVEPTFLERAIQDSKGETMSFDPSQSEKFGYRKPLSIARTLRAENNSAGCVIENYRIRKLTERECFRLMGVKQEDFEKFAKNQSTSSCYHLAGDSIVTTCLMAIFGELFNFDYQEKINELVEELKQ